jgi:hypothetical protein
MTRFLRSFVNIREHRTQIYFQILSLTVRESSSGETKDKKKEIEWDCKQTIFKIWGFKKKPAFCVRSSMFGQKPYRNSFKSCHQLPDKKVEETMSKKSERGMWYWRKL